MRPIAPSTLAAAAVALALAAGGCRPAPAPTPEAPPTGEVGGGPAAEEDGGASAPSSGPDVFAVFEGDLPSADGSGVRTRLTLYTETDRYRLEETYLGAADGRRPRTSEGRWTTLRGSAVDPDATVYVLDPQDPRRARNFLRLGEDAVEELDHDQRRIRTGPSHRLARVGAP